MRTTSVNLVAPVGGVRPGVSPLVTSPSACRDRRGPWCLLAVVLLVGFVAGCGGEGGGKAAARTALQTGDPDAEMRDLRIGDALNQYEWRDVALPPTLDGGVIPFVPTVPDDALVEEVAPAEDQDAAGTEDAAWDLVDATADVEADDAADADDGDADDGDAAQDLGPVTLPPLDALVDVQPEDTYVAQDTYVAPEDTYVAQDTYVPPEDTYVALKDTYVAPQDTYVAPQDTSVPLQDTYVPPEDTYVAPKDTYVPPQDTYVAPKDTYVPPQDTYVAPKDTYVPPQDTYVAPKDTYVPPQDTYVAPKDTYVPPEDTYVAPKDTYVPPEDTYVAPKDTYVPPEDTYVAPKDTAVQDSYVPDVVKDTSAKDTAVQDTASPDAVKDTSAKDTAVQDTYVADTAKDTSSADTAPKDTSSDDTAAADTTADIPPPPVPKGGGAKGPTVLPWPISPPSSFQPAKVLYDPTGYHTIALTLPKSSWNSYLDGVKAHSSGSWYAADVTIDGTLYKKVGIKSFGYGSTLSNPDKPNVKIAFDHYITKQKGPAGVKSLRLKASGQDPTFLRQPLFQALVNQLGGSAPRFSWSRTEVNGENYGLYQVIENADKAMYHDFFGNNDGNQYEDSKACQGLNCPGGSCPAIKSYYKAGPGNYGDLIALVTTIKNGAKSAWVESVQGEADLDNLLAYETMEAFASDIDGLSAAGQNFSMYGDEKTKVLYFIPTGPDLTFGNWNAYYDFAQPWGPPNSWCDGRTDEFYQRAWADSTTHAMMAAKLKALHCQLFSTSKAYAIIDGYKKLLGPDLYADPKKNVSKGQIDGEFSGLKSWISSRNAKLEKVVGGCK